MLSIQEQFLEVERVMTVRHGTPIISQAAQAAAAAAAATGKRDRYLGNKYLSSGV